MSSILVGGTKEKVKALSREDLRLYTTDNF